MTVINLAQLMTPHTSNVQLLLFLLYSDRILSSAETYCLLYSFLNGLLEYLFSDNFNLLYEETSLIIRRYRALQKVGKPKLSVNVFNVCFVYLSHPFLP